MSKVPSEKDDPIVVLFSGKGVQFIVRESGLKKLSSALRCLYFLVLGALFMLVVFKFDLQTALTLINTLNLK